MNLQEEKQQWRRRKSSERVKRNPLELSLKHTNLGDGLLKIESHVLTILEKEILNDLSKAIFSKECEGVAMLFGLVHSNWFLKCGMIWLLINNFYTLTLRKNLYTVKSPKRCNKYK